MSYLFFDIDNTLLSHKTFTIPQSAMKALWEVKNHGHQLFIASGRGRNSILEYEDPDLFDGSITGSGAHGHYHGNALFNHTFSEEDVIAISDIAKETGAGLFVQSDTRSWMSEVGLEVFKRRSGRTEQQIYDMGIRIFHGIPEEPICKMDFFLPVGIDGEEVYRRFPETVEICRALSEYKAFPGAELTPKGISKGTGIRELIELIGGSMEDTYAFGDSDNDIEMLKACAVGTAMGNASDMVKQAADYVTADIEEDGIYLALKHFGLF